MLFGLRAVAAELDLDVLAHADGGHLVVAERGEPAAHRFSLRIEDVPPERDVHACLHACPRRFCSMRPNGSRVSASNVVPVRRSNASM